jgi:hypothetical protein
MRIEISRQQIVAQIDRQIRAISLNGVKCAINSSDGLLLEARDSQQVVWIPKRAFAKQRTYGSG